MPDINRSKKYDWFQHGDEKNKNTFKYKFSVFLKIFKIIFLFSIFTSTIWGCVQSFIIKSDSEVGKGFEFYGSESEIAPHVTKFNINSKKVLNDITNTEEQIYSLEKTKQKIWINHKTNSDKLKQIHTQITKEGTAEVKHKMSDAFKGQNELILFGNKEQDLIFPKDKDDNLLALSSFSTKSLFDFTDFSNTFKIGDQTINLSEDSIDNSISEKNKQQIKAKYDFAKAFISSVSTQMDKAYNENNFLFSKIEEKDSEFLKQKKIAKIKTIQQIFNYLQMDNFGAFENKEAVLNLETNNFKYFYINSEKAFFEIKEKNLKKITTSISAKFNSNFLAFNEDNNYRPMVTWKHAWVRGFGPFYGIFVFPISKLANLIFGNIPALEGWESLISLVLFVFSLRILGFLISFKSILQQTKQQELNAKKSAIDAKYANYAGNKQMEARKKQEIAELYKKANISPLGGLSNLLITMPMFFAIWRIIIGLPQLKSTIWLGINFSSTSYKELFNGQFQYLPLIITAAGSSLLSHFLPQLLNKKRDKNRLNIHQKEALKKNNKTQNIMGLIFVFFAVSFSAGIQIYWIVGGIWQMIQTFISHKVLIYQKRKQKKL